jgi:hypothetical protein
MACPEDRALLGSNPSAEAGNKTKPKRVTTVALFYPDRWLFIIH